MTFRTKHNQSFTLRTEAIKRLDSLTRNGTMAWLNESHGAFVVFWFV